jgi:hypothetical protein
LVDRGWIEKSLDSRALSVTRKGARQFPAFFGAPDAQAAHDGLHGDAHAAA